MNRRQLLAWRAKVKKAEATIIQDAKRLIIIRQVAQDFIFIPELNRYANKATPDKTMTAEALHKLFINEFTGAAGLRIFLDSFHSTLGNALSTK
jgi:hypothetical protein